ncbi:hypothetical protein JTE90_019641 [Oedothorax gibbosus]|uniref:Uncharacterized protein n=1 Tax=Oedothorax gibbosus TaxID=931172 RepID=A0AAV6U124_9ARAC|nr:hypothetical protein JTE90_019641 [Oedothorax gibbosus]
MLYDRINTRSYCPIKCPPSDALDRAKEVLSELDTWPDDTDPDVQELRDILCDPHFRVSVPHELRNHELNYSTLSERGSEVVDVVSRH